MQDKIIINDYIENDPLSEDNLDKILNCLYEIRLSSPQKSIWMYTGYAWEDLAKYEYGTTYINNINVDALRQAIISQCDVIIDGRYIDSRRDITLPYRGSSNQRLIDVQKSLQKGEMVLWTY